MQPETLDEFDRERLDELVKGIWEIFYRKFPRAALYSDRSKHEGWNFAVEWYNNWNANFGKPGDLPVPQVSRTNKVRDALNAAWLYRVNNWDLDNPERRLDRTERIASAAYNLCLKIIEDPNTAAQSKAPPGR
jgi:hypothetical protein